ncbi:MAG: HAMP domain-containing protein, partial [Bacillota bacterium]|nr:HAMP domain-containing protein [Bacillota bacterium]
MNKSYVLSKLFNHAKILRFKEYINKNSRFQIIFIYNIMLTTLLLVLSPLIPFILNYPPGFKEASKALNSSYFQKQIIFLIVSAVLSSIFLMRSLRILHNWKNAVKNADYEKITSIRTKCLAAPYKIYFLQIALFTAIVGVLIFAFTVTHKSAVYFRIVLMIFSFMSLFSLVIFVLTNRVFKQILVETFNGHVLQGQRIGLRSKIFLQIAPIFISTILLTSMIGYSRLIEEKGDLYAQIFMDALENKLKYVSVNASQDDIWKALSTITYSEDNFTTFLITPENNIVTSDNQKLNSIMLYYIEKLKHAFEGRFYDMTCETQGVIKKISIGNNYYTTGIKFSVASQKTVIFFLIAFFVLLLFCVINLFSFSKSIVSEISIVANALSKIAEDEKVNLDQKIPVTSNDEIGELIVAFSKIQELTKANIK